MNKFKLVRIDAFDARCGYSRWVARGVGSSVSGVRGSVVKAGIWIDRHGKLVTRFTSPSHRCCDHFEIQCLEPIRIIPDMKEDIENFLSEMIFEWYADDFPDDFGL